MIRFSYNLSVDKKKLKDTVGRVYLFVSNNIIKKIGYSQDKGGIKGTLSAYQGGMQGRPSIRTMGIHLLLKREIENGKKVEVYMILADPTVGRVKGLFGYHKMKISPTIEMEEACKKDYLKQEGDYPDWNIQERKNTEWPDWIKEAHSKLLEQSL